jgi:hypothetical protein
MKDMELMELNLRLMENNLHNIALRFMEMFEHLEPMSLDEFLGLHENALTEEELALGNAILKQFEYMY